MYEFNFHGQEKEPTKEEILQGFIHYTATLLNLHGAGKHTVAKFRELETRPIAKGDVHFIMNRCCDQVDRIKTILVNCPTIKVEKSDDNSEAAD